MTAQDLRLLRNRMLNDVDLRYCNAERWAAMTPEKRAEWSAYKQAMRDLPDTYDPENPVWPVMPT